jgi:hypothetical protein
MTARLWRRSMRSRAAPLYDDVAEFEGRITEWATDPERTISELARVWPDVDWSRPEAPRTRRLEQGSRAQASAAGIGHSRAPRV